jgi:hexosaminidase
MDVSSHAAPSCRRSAFRRRALIAAVTLGAVVVAAAQLPEAAAAAGHRPAQRPVSAGVPSVIPAPASLQMRGGQSFRLAADAEIVVGGGGARVWSVATGLASQLRRSTGFRLPVVTRRERSSRRDISLRLAPLGLGAEGYRLTVTRNGVKLRAATAAGLFHAVQTLRQLLPAAAESATVRPGPWTIPAVRIVDRPRFRYRGAMLDVSRHFFSVAEVERYIDLISMYKINTLHLHLSDDQGWRIAIDRWPRLATYGGSTEVGGTPGGYYTKADFRQIVRYAAAHFITIVPEIDTPGHTNAALASYAELNCNGQAPPLYTGTDVGFSSLCVDNELTYRFLDDVVGEIAAMSPGPIYHLGGDEAHSTPHEQYVRFIDREAGIVRSHGKRVMGWNEIAGANVAPGSIAEYWNPAQGTAEGTELARTAVQKGLKLVMAPASKAYLDMQYDPTTPYGLHWAGYVSVQESYSWDPATFVQGVGESDVLGVEAPVWSETLPDIHAVEFMAFPRLPGIAEIGWSPRQGRSWSEYRLRLAAQGPRWDALGVNYYHAPEVPWPPSAPPFGSR